MKNFILDTNVLLHDPYSIVKFGDNCVIIPLEVIEELDHFKRDVSDLGSNARRVVKHLDRIRHAGNVRDGVELDGGGTLRITAGPYSSVLGGSLSCTNTSMQLLSLAKDLYLSEPDRSTILVTKSFNLRLKADALNISTSDYEEPLFDGNVNYVGYREIELNESDAASFRRDGSLRMIGDFFPNECLALSSADGGKQIGRIDANDHNLVKRINHLGNGILGVEPLNLAQLFALDLLMTPEIKLVTLTGRAGTGKTLLAVAAGLHQVLEDDRYHKLLVSRPTMPMGRDIGFIPGDVEEKLKPWMKPIYDAVEFLQSIDRRSSRRRLPSDLLEAKEIEVEPLTYIRGRSIPNQYMIIDEAQNLTPLEIKTIVTRVGHGTKIVLTGDPEQIDDPYMDSMSNGLIHVINRFRKERIAGHITLSKGERSELAECAARLL